MKRRLQHLIPLAMVATALALWGLYKLFPWLLRHHALNAESPYFLPACVICAFTPVVTATLYISYRALSRRMDEQRSEDEINVRDPNDIDRDL
jgi:hypothetical protein